MTYIVIGLGSFGAELAERLTSLGHEVIGVDKNMQRIDELKDTISVVLCLDIMEKQSLNMLPLNDAERVYVSIGEDFGASVLSAALLLQMGVKRITARAVSKLHQSILEAMGIGNIILPEVYVADLLSNEAEFPHLKGFYSVTDDVKFVESIVPPVIAGQSIEAVDFPRTFGLQILGVKRPETSKNIIGKKTVIYELLSPDAKLVIQSEDLLLLYGGLSSLKKFKKQFG